MRRADPRRDTGEPKTDSVTTGDAELVARAAGGSEQAFRLLYRADVRPLYWIAHRLLGDSSDAEDVVQETFVVAWRKLPELDLASDSLLPWLATICRFQAANRMRAQRRDRENTAAVADDTLPAAVDVEQQMIDEEYLRLIAAELATLSDTAREILRLCAADGYACSAAAEHLGIPHGAVRNRLSRIRTRLRTVAKEST